MSAAKLFSEIFDEFKKAITDQERIKNTMKFLKDQIVEIEKIAEIKSKEYFLNKNKLFGFQKDLKQKEEELNCYIIMFPNWEVFKEHREELGIYDEMEELKEDIEHLRTSINILSKTLELQKQNIDTEIQKIVRLNIDLSWLKRD